MLTIGRTTEFLTSVHPGSRPWDLHEDVFLGLSLWSISPTAIWKVGNEWKQRVGKYMWETPVMPGPDIQDPFRKQGLRG